MRSQSKNLRSHFLFKTISEVDEKITCMYTTFSYSTYMTDVKYELKKKKKQLFVLLLDYFLQMRNHETLPGKWL